MTGGTLPGDCGAPRAPGASRMSTVLSPAGGGSPDTSAGWGVLGELVDGAAGSSVTPRAAAASVILFTGSVASCGAQNRRRSVRASSAVHEERGESASSGVAAVVVGRSSAARIGAAVGRTASAGAAAFSAGSGEVSGRGSLTGLSGVAGRCGRGRRGRETNSWTSGGLVADGCKFVCGSACGERP